jgi:hypothetical protein
MIDFHHSYNWKPRYLFLSLGHFFGDFFRDIKWFFQRGARGYSDSDVWNFDCYLSDVIYNGLKQLKEIKHGFPCGYKENWKKAERNWDRDLQIMIDGFKSANEIGENSFVMGCSKTETEIFLGREVPKFDIRKYEREIAKRQKKLDKAMDLFKKHFFNLWD